MCYRKSIEMKECQVYRLVDTSEQQQGQEDDAYEIVW